MKNILIFFFLALAFGVNAQAVARWGQVPYAPYAPTARPALSNAQIWFNTANGSLYTYSRDTRTWSKLGKEPAYAEMSISNDTSTISFAATTAAPIEDLTAGLMSGFTRVSDSLLRYDGLATGRFLVNYSGTLAFAEAANIISGWVEIEGTTQLRTRFRQSTTLTTEKENFGGTGLVTLAPGDLIRFLFVPITHTGTDILSIYEFNLNFTQLN